jgi:hypothetical protein
VPHGVSPTRLLASALLHVLERDEAPPARWRVEPFVLAVAQHRMALAGARATADLDLVATLRIDHTFRGAVAALGSDPLAAALAVRRLELTRQMPLPAWPTIVGRGIGPRVTHADTARWFG